VTNGWTDVTDAFSHSPTSGCDDWGQSSPNNKTGLSNMSQTLQGFFTRVILQHPPKKTATSMETFRISARQPKLAPKNPTVAPSTSLTATKTAKQSNRGTKHLPYEK